MSKGLDMALDFRDDGLTDGEVQAMARRQFGVSLVVGLALLVAAVAIGSRAAQVAPADVLTCSRIIITHPEGVR